jgi:hypothetical protein
VNRSLTHPNPHWYEESIAAWKGGNDYEAPVGRSLLYAGWIYRPTKNAFPAKAWHLVIQGCLWADEVFNENWVWAFVQKFADKLLEKRRLSQEQILSFVREQPGKRMSPKWRRRLDPVFRQSPEYRAWLRKRKTGGPKS